MTANVAARRCRRSRCPIVRYWRRPLIVPRRTEHVLVAEDMRGLVELSANGVFKRLSSAAQHERAMRHKNVLERETGQAAKHGT